MINNLLEITEKSIADTIGFYDWEEEECQKEIFSYISYGKKDYGEITATIYQRVVCPSFSGSLYDPPYGFEAEYYIEDADVSIFNTKGDYLPNISEKIKELLEAKKQYQLC